MATDEIQPVVDKLKELPPEGVAEVEDFIDFLSQRIHNAGTRTPMYWEEIPPEPGTFSYSPIAAQALASFSSANSVNPSWPCHAARSSRWTRRRTTTVPSLCAAPVPVGRSM